MSDDHDNDRSSAQLAELAASPTDHLYRDVIGVRVIATFPRGRGALIFAHATLRDRDRRGRIRHRAVIAHALPGRDALRLALRIDDRDLDAMHDALSDLLDARDAAEGEGAA